MDEELHYKKRLISEMIFIRRQTHGLNLQMDMEELPMAYFPIIAIKARIVIMSSQSVSFVRSDESF